MENSSVKDCFVNIRVTEELKAKLVKEASDKKLTVSKLANRLFTKYFDAKIVKVPATRPPSIAEEKPTDIKQVIIVSSIVSVVILVWFFVTNRPRKNEFRYKDHTK